MGDRELYLPRSWTTDPDRGAAAGVPDDVEFVRSVTVSRVRSRWTKIRNEIKNKKIRI